MLSKFFKKAILYYKVGVKGATLLRAYKMVKYFVLTHVFGKQIPWLLEFSLTYKCQCKCVHCSTWNLMTDKSNKNDLTTDEIKRVLDETANLGIPKVDFFGGEPLLKKGIVDLVSYGAQKGLYISITTNGWKLDKDLVVELKKAGLACINISLDSIQEEVHDNLRGLPGVFQRAVEGIKNCHEVGIPCIVSTYVTKKRIVNFDTNQAESTLGKIINFSKDLGATGIRILFPIISGQWENKKENEFTEKEKQLVMDHIDYSFAFIEGAYAVINGKKICQSLIGKMFNISPYGDVQLCVAFPDTFGNVKDRSLNELLDGMYSHPIYLRNKGKSTCSTQDLIRPDGSVVDENAIGCGNVADEEEKVEDLQDVKK